MYLPARKSITPPLSAILTQHALVEEIDEGELATMRTLRKGNNFGWLVHKGNASFTSGNKINCGGNGRWYQRLFLLSTVL